MEVAELEETAPKPRTQAEKFKLSKAVESFIADGESTLPSQTRTTNTIPPPHYDKPVFSARFNRLLAEHLFAMGHYQSALALVNQIHDCDKIFVRIIEEAIAIREALLHGETKSAHKWFNESNFRLKHSEVCLLNSSFLNCYRSIRIFNWVLFSHRQALTLICVSSSFIFWCEMIREWKPSRKIIIIFGSLSSSCVVIFFF